MAKIQCTKEGAQAMLALSQALAGTGDSLQEAGNKLRSTVSSAGDLGEVEGEILDLVQQVVNAQQPAQEAVAALSANFQRVANRINQIAARLS